jgi:hypothetical protein
MVEVSDVFGYIISAIKFSITGIIFPMAKILLYFLFIVLIITFIANISGILGFLIFMLMFYYYVKGIIYIEPAYANNVIK